MAPDSPDSSGSPDSTPSNLVLRVYEAMDATHPGGMRANRAFPTPQQDHLDPFVLFERFYIAPDQGFGTHPHRGFEIVSYMLEGGMAHEDSIGHESVAREGDAMHVRTGSGMTHSELPAENDPCSGLQLWVNLPRKQKQLDPLYDDADAGELPEERVEGATITTVVGDGSSLDLVTDMEYLDVEIDPGAEWTWSVPGGWTGYLYVLSGSGVISGFGTGGECELEQESVAVTQDSGDFEVETTDGARFVAVSGEPHGEPIRQRGPFVD